MGYGYRECCSISLGMIFLVGGILSDLALPFFIGRVIDHLEKDEIDEIETLCLYMLIIIIVSKLFRIQFCGHY